MFALIDGDILTYRSGFAAEHNHYVLLGGPSGAPVREFKDYAEVRAFIKENPDEAENVTKYRTYDDVSHALANVRNTIHRILEETGSSEYHVFLSSGYNWRGEVATIKKYKGNRDDAVKPVYYDDIHTYLTKYHPTTKLESIEADDAMAMLQTDHTVICSVDKDMLQVPGKHYNWTKDEGERKTLVTPEVGILKLYKQVLTGDATDNIPGIKGVGDKKAVAILLEANTVDPDELRAICTDHWREYLSTSPEPFEYDKESDSVVFEHWEKGPWVLSVVDVVTEVRRLLTVGGEDAYEALHRSSDTLPDTS